MNPKLFSSAALLPLVLTACGAPFNDTPTKALGQQAQPELVDSVAETCITPDPSGYESISTVYGGALEEWRESVDAMPASATKTDLQNRMLTALKSPYAAFATPAEAQAFLRGIRTPLPLKLPFTANSPYIAGTEVNLGHAWRYNGGGIHRGLDISRDNTPDDKDPSFDVLAVADGKVIAVYFDGPPGGGGNTIVIEHTGANGKKIYSFYMHLRNGRAHDVAAVKALTCPVGDTECSGYKLMAQNYPNHPSWGTDSDTITVVPGQWVTQGQKIAKSGNTMTASPFAADGKPASNHARNHLHVYIAVPTPTDPKVVVEVDPYGVYEKQSSGCYADFQPTYYPRLWLPHYPDFHNVTWDTFVEQPEYYSGMSYRPQTLSFYEQSGVLKVAGSYQYSSDKNWGVQAGLDSAGFDTVVEQWRQAGYVPRETRIRIDGAGNARYSTLFGKLRTNESTRFEHRLTQASLDSLYTTYVVNAGWRVEDIFPYREAGVQYYAVLFSNSDSTRWLRYSATQAYAESEIASLPAQGLHVENIVADPTVSPPRFAYIANDASGCTPHVYVNAAMSTYQTAHNTESAMGYSLKKVQVYNNGANFTAIFDKGSGTCQ
ncbi:M23 family metallopeptidase [Pyxidicoccus parkwayensis]|uniref:M23 family metallopeptidase n=1 Tax=Pyxidicoccus parkwayensis TaxID=2813578 RepID=A0ABX7NMD4_9BACT|nr:M23 family metallopeptidase [Pyxidicoccus parkwaysis]QSQ20027.1 M23 family metallopeptidase [Pyxidicoccus parkwaysis]